MFNDMEKEITSSCYQLPPLELLDEYASEGNVVSIGKTALDEKAASERKVVPDEEIAGKTESFRTALGKGKVPVKDIKAVPGPAVTLTRSVRNEESGSQKSELLWKTWRLTCI